MPGLETEILTNLLESVLSGFIKKPFEEIINKATLGPSINKAVKKAEKRFVQDYQIIDPEIASILVNHSYLLNLSSVKESLKIIFSKPFQEHVSKNEIIRYSFSDIFPDRIDRERIDLATSTFLTYIGQEVLYIKQLQPYYAILFQKNMAESSRETANNTAILAGSINEVIEGILHQKNLLNFEATKQLPQATDLMQNSKLLHNLPQRPYSFFVGREKELDKLKSLLLPYPKSRHFLITLDGIGGVGKSSLALELGNFYRENYELLSVAERFESIVWVSAKRNMLTATGIKHRQQTFNNLSDLFRAISTVMAKPAILQVDLEQQRNLVEQALCEKRTLLILDNLETVDDEELLTFLRELPDPTKAIITTRHRIDIAFPIPLKGMPDTDALELLHLEAEQKDIKLSAEDTLELHRRTGGIPLAIVLSIGMISQGLNVISVIRRLGSGQNDIAKFCFDESVSLIQGKDAFRLLAALALFEDSVNREMLGQVAGLGTDYIGRDDGIAKLLELSLINQDQGRFSMLPLTRSYTLDKLSNQSELENSLKELWITTLLSFAEHYAGYHWKWRKRSILKNEGEHFSSFAKWAQVNNHPEIVLKIFPLIAFYFDIKGRWNDTVTVGEYALDYAKLVGEKELSVFCCQWLCWIFGQRGNYDKAHRMLTELLSTIDNPVWMSSILGTQSQIYRRQELFDKAKESCEKALTILRGFSGPEKRFAVTDIIYEKGKISRDMGNWVDAQTYFLEARKVFRYEEENSEFNYEEENPEFNIEMAQGLYCNLGLVAHKLGALDLAHKIYNECLKAYKEIVGVGDIATLEVRLAALEEQRGNYGTALSYASSALIASRELGMLEEKKQAEDIYNRLKALLP